MKRWEPMPLEELDALLKEVLRPLRRRRRKLHVRVFTTEQQAELDSALQRLIFERMRRKMTKVQLVEELRKLYALKFMLTGPGAQIIVVKRNF